MTASRHIDIARAAVRGALKGNPLIWFGIRGEDASPLLPDLTASYAITAPLHSLDESANVSLEMITGLRPDLDRYDIDLDPSPEAADFRRRMLQGVSGRCTVITYRPAEFISRLAFAMSHTMTLASMHKDRQAAFENKPWVETEVAGKVPDLGWRYVSDHQRIRAKQMLAVGPVVLRVSRASGGVGITRVDTEEELEREWPEQPEEFVGVARFIDNAIPINLSGCVFKDGALRLHPASVQLIGIESCIDRPFGYCGNDFGAVLSLGADVFAQLEALARTVGAWLYSERYVGAFGVDAMIEDDRVFFTEVNARFQGSSAISAEIAEEAGVPSLHLDHLAAALGLTPSGPDLALAEWAREGSARSHIVVHNVTDEIVGRRAGARTPRAARINLLPLVKVAPGGVLARATLDRSVTRTGLALDTNGEVCVREISDMFAPVSAAGSED